MASPFVEQEPDTAKTPFAPQAWRSVLLGALLLGWVPAARYAAGAPLTQGVEAALPVWLFLAGALGAAPLARLLKRFPQRLALWVPVLLSIAGTALFAGTLLAETGTRIALTSASLALTGLSFALQLLGWLQCSLDRRPQEMAAAVLTCVLVSSVLMAACLHAPAWVSYGVALVGTAAFGLVCARPEHTGTDAGSGQTRATADIKDSKLLRIAAGHLRRRYGAAFCLLGVCTGAMLSLFAMGIPTPPDAGTEAFAPLGALLLGAFIALGWARNHEPDFLLSFALSVLAAVLVFFPFYPGSRFNQQLSLALGSIWAVVLYGSFLLVTYEVNRSCAPVQKPCCALGQTALASGAFVGSLAMAAVLQTPWFKEAAVGSYPRIMFVTACGALSIVAAYVCTNVLLNRDLLRNVKLLARGTFLSTLRLPLDFEAPRDARQAPEIQSQTHAAPSPGMLEAHCRDIALQAGLTPREYDVLVILAHGNSMARVQRDLVISEGTAITHRRNLYRKLGVASKQELIDYVRQTEGPEA